ncbi:hypothetical protein BGW36DRAFT_106593 [Talaromyces proteolyticus]|uniref:Uncharacterized protein n=1 Tax=Talaromyces proteolyticus TaxID=1131652 RepID=A0AAD4KV78_9EURO|nr:uncharacterized protein BGW36DRAFT_106593 [Talaromyces proteolyticus]KAH8701848.1 hypothetical protein BGW36DRAFT_106593 [Talaromyces proteolyticus]
MGLVEKLQSKLELYRLEQRYTRRRHRSMLFNDVQYVDGEYVYNSSSPTSPTGTVSKSSTGSHWRPSWGRSTTSDSR